MSQKYLRASCPALGVEESQDYTPTGTALEGAIGDRLKATELYRKPNEVFWRIKKIEMGRETSRTIHRHSTPGQVELRVLRYFKYGM